MIRIVRILSLDAVRRDFDDNPSPAMLAANAWIGFEPEGPSPLRAAFPGALAGPNALLLSMESAGPNGPMLFHARKIVDFVRSFHARPDPGVLTVHCTYGETRSAAVGIWVAEALALPVTIPPLAALACKDYSKRLLALLREADAARGEPPLETMGPEFRALFQEHPTPSPTSPPLPPLAPGAKEAAPLPLEGRCPCCQRARDERGNGQLHWIGPTMGCVAKLFPCSVCERTTRVCEQVHRARQPQRRSAFATLLGIVGALGVPPPRF